MDGGYFRNLGSIAGTRIIDPELYNPAYYDGNRLGGANSKMNKRAGGGLYAAGGGISAKRSAKRSHGRGIGKFFKNVGSKISNWAKSDAGKKIWKPIAKGAIDTVAGAATAYAPEAAPLTAGLAKAGNNAVDGAGLHYPGRAHVFRRRKHFDVGLDGGFVGTQRLPQALQSKPFGANFLMATQLPPRFQRFNTGTVLPGRTLNGDWEIDID